MRDHAAPPHFDSAGEAPSVASLLAEWLERCASVRIAVRDGEGRFVRTGAPGGITSGFYTTEERRDVIGSAEWPTMRYIDTDGRELRLLDHPAHVARLSGQPQIGKMVGLRAPDGDTKWYFGDYIPTNPSGAGYEVVSVVMDVTEAQQPRRAAQSRARSLEVLLDTTVCLSGVPAELPALAAALRPAIESVAPQTHSLVVHRDASGQGLRGRVITELPGIARVAGPTPLTAEVRALLESTHVNNDLQVTDIYGPYVVGGDEVPARSLCVVPVRTDGADGALVGAIAAFSQSAGYFDDDRVDLLERLARVARPSLQAIVASAPRGSFGPS